MPKTSLSSEVTNKRVKLNLNGYVIKVDAENGMAVEVTDPDGSDIMNTSQGNLTIDMKGNSKVSGVIVANRSFVFGNKQTVSASPYRETEDTTIESREPVSYWKRKITVPAYYPVAMCATLGLVFLFSVTFGPLLINYVAHTYFGQPDIYPRLKEYLR